MANRVSLLIILSMSRLDWPVLKPIIIQMNTEPVALYISRHKMNEMALVTGHVPARPRHPE